MRVPFLRAAALTAAVSSFLAGEARAEVRAGIFAGVSLFEWKVADEAGVTFGSRTGFGAGAVLDLGLGKRVSLRLEPGYVEKGTEITFEADGFLFDERTTGNLRESYVELPALLTVRLATGGVRPYLLAGPTAAYLTSARVSADEAEDVSEQFEKWDFGVAAGAGIEFGSGRGQGFVEARYTWGLTRIIADPEEGDPELKNRGLQVLAGVTFSLGK